MNRPPTKQGGASKPRQFRFTDAEITRIDAVALTLAEPGVPVTRTTVLRLAFEEFEAKRRGKDREN